jgi:hypothetical protein
MPQFFQTGVEIMERYLTDFNLGMIAGMCIEAICIILAIGVKTWKTK